MARKLADDIIDLDDTTNTLLLHSDFKTSCFVRHDGRSGGSKIPKQISEMNKSAN